MGSLSDSDLRQLLRAALKSPYGVAVETNSPSRLSARLHHVRASAPEFAVIVIAKSRLNPDKEIWLTLSRSKANGQETGEDDDPS